MQNRCAYDTIQSHQNKKHKPTTYNNLAIENSLRQFRTGLQVPLAHYPDGVILLDSCGMCLTRPARFWQEMEGFDGQIKLALINREKLVVFLEEVRRRQWSVLAFARHQKRNRLSR